MTLWFKRSFAFCLLKKQRLSVKLYFNREINAKLSPTTHSESFYMTMLYEIIFFSSCGFLFLTHLLCICRRRCHLESLKGGKEKNIGICYYLFAHG